MSESAGKHHDANPPGLPLTSRAEAALCRATDDARLRHHDFIGSVHLLLALLKDQGSAALAVLNAFHVALENLRHEADALAPAAPVYPSHWATLSMSLGLHRTLELAQSVAAAMRHDYVTTAHLLLGILHNTAGSEDLIALLGRYNVSAGQARLAASEILAHSRIDGDDPSPLTADGGDRPLDQDAANAHAQALGKAMSWLHDSNTAAASFSLGITGATTVAGTQHVIWNHNAVKDDGSTLPKPGDKRRADDAVKSASPSPPRQPMCKYWYALTLDEYRVEYGADTLAELETLVKMLGKCA